MQNIIIMASLNKKLGRQDDHDDIKNRKHTS